MVWEIFFKLRCHTNKENNALTSNSSPEEQDEESVTWNHSICIDIFNLNFLVFFVSFTFVAFQLQCEISMIFFKFQKVHSKLFECKYRHGFAHLHHMISCRRCRDDRWRLPRIGRDKDAVEQGNSCKYFTSILPNSSECKRVEFHRCIKFALNLWSLVLRVLLCIKKIITPLGYGCLFQYQNNSFCSS